MQNVVINKHKKTVYYLKFRFTIHSINDEVSFQTRRGTILIIIFIDCLNLDILGIVII